jgi:hypothetical protein
MLAFVARNRSRVFDGDDLLVFVRHEDWFFATFDAFLRAGRVRRIGAFRTALGITDPTIPATLIWTGYRYHAAKQESNHRQCNLLHYGSPIGKRMRARQNQSGISDAFRSLRARCPILIAKPRRFAGHKYSARREKMCVQEAG